MSIVTIITSRDFVDSSNIDVSKKIINVSINLVVSIIIRVNSFIDRVTLLRDVNINNSEFEYVLKIDKNNKNNNDLFIIIEDKKIEKNLSV